ncbi:YdjY domain-containing protein [Verrucomicrobiota bacterium]
MRIRISILLLIFIAGCSREGPEKQPVPEKNNAIAEQKGQPAQKEGKAQEDPKLSPREKNKAIVKRAYQDNLTRHKDNSDILVLPGLVADRKTKQIIIQAEATGLGENEAIEFFLIAEESTHDYEALLVAFARPSDIHKALEFIGMTPGRPINYKKLRFWSKGERVFITVRSNDAKILADPVSLEKMILNRNTNKPLLTRGLVFTGSMMVESMEQEGVYVYAADARGPHVIASNYNEPESTLDVPRNAPQSDVYETMSTNPEYILPQGGLIEILMEPEYKDEKKRVVELLLDVHVKQQVSGFRFQVSDNDGKVLNEKRTLNGVLAEVEKLINKGHDPFITVHFSKDLSLKAIKEICAVLAAIETDQGIRVEPPPAGQLYYKAFLPDEKHRDREKRIAQPWELHFTLKGSGATATLTKIKQIWKKEVVMPDLEITDYDIPTPAVLRKTLDEKGPGQLIILVYAPDSMTHGQLMEYLNPVLSTHPTVHVFLEHR